MSIGEIEGRLEQSVGPRFEPQLQSCDDLCGVARLILMLQRRTELRDAESGWLEELAQLSPAELDENPPKLALQLRRRLEELRACVRPEVAPSSLIGATVLRRLDSAAQTTSAQAVHKGVVIEHARASASPAACSRAVVFASSAFGGACRLRASASPLRSALRSLLFRSPCSCISSPPPPSTGRSDRRRRAAPSLRSRARRLRRPRALVQLCLHRPPSAAHAAFARRPRR